MNKEYNFSAYYVYCPEKDSYIIKEAYRILIQNGEIIGKIKVKDDREVLSVVLKEI